ncbi:ATP-binding protein [Kutzneria albida]|uniref:HTH luxR-type domain-containing protein n=1 Tax=Kutzneria albida DSM 43870 TaxID=1449976 RepID=W5WD12_9PSEU|nr:LuxR family transcriptional regulator [Kutzneria albida]AHH98737.1 hypothetical protein KALB_5375 [Kutzneria albida DSM 43870]
MTVITRGTGICQTPLVGRDDILAAVLVAGRSRPALIGVRGGPGMGKSCLLAELQRIRPAPFRHVLHARCRRGSCTPLAPVLEALLSDTSAPWSPDATAALGPLLPELADRLPPTLAGAPDLHRIFRALRQVLCGPDAVLLLLDDVDQADTTTCAFLDYLTGTATGDLAVVLAHTSRVPHVGLAEAGTMLTLTPLDLTQTAELVRALLGCDAIPEDVATALFDRSAGCPRAITAAVEQVLHEPDSCGRSVWSALRDLHVPTRLVDTIAEEMADLDAATRAVITAAAVWATGATEDQLRALTALPVRRCESALDTAVGHGLLRVAGTGYRCRSEFVRRAVEHAVVASQRRRAHRRAATLLDAAGQPAPLVARHLREAGDLDHWREYSEGQADTALAAGDWSTAVQLLSPLVEDEQQDEARRVRIAVKLGSAAFEALDYRASVRILRQILGELVLPERIRGQLRNDLGVLLLSQVGDHQAGYDELEHAAAELRDSAPEIAARVMSTLANPYAGRRHVSTHLRWLAEIETLSPVDLDPVGAAIVRVNRATALLTCGLPEAWEHTEFVLGDSEHAELRRQLMRGCLNIADSAAWLGHHEVATRFLARGQHWSQTLGAAHLTELLEVAALTNDWLTGRWQGLERRAESLAQRCQGLPVVEAECRLIAGALAMEAGASERGRALLPGISAARTTSAGAPPVAITASAVLARDHLRRGRRAEAWHEARAALAVVERTGQWVWASELAPVLGELLLDNGDHAALEQLLDCLQSGVDGRDAPAAFAGLDLCRAMALQAGGADTAQVLHAYQVAAEAFDAVPRPYWAATALLLRSRFAGPGPGAQDAAAAADRFRALGCTVAVRLCEDLLGVPEPARRGRGRPGYGVQLSPREAQVARLAGRGWTNARIAQSLGLSVRTVEQHVSRAMRKTGAPSRFALGG